MLLLLNRRWAGIGLLWLTATRLLAGPVGSDFTYQGYLTDLGVPANGSYDLRVGLFDAPDSDNQIGPALTHSGVAISNGCFAVALDFGSAFDGQNRWLEIAVRSGTNDFLVLSPRQPITPTPYALTALNVSGPLSLTNAASTIAGTFFGSGAGLTNLDTSAVEAWVLGQGFQMTNGLTRRALATSAPFAGTNYIVDFLAEVVQIAATNHLHFQQSTNRPAAGWYAESVWYVQGGPANYTLQFNTNWVGLGTLAATAPVLIPSNKLTVVALAARGPGETNVTYAIARQE
jgi:hypothetical protein